MRSRKDLESFICALSTSQDILWFCMNGWRHLLLILYSSVRSACAWSCSSRACCRMDSILWCG